MNEDTRIAVCCYQGDQPQVVANLDNYLQHNRPVVILSPDDSRVEITHPGIENRFAGKRAYTGQESLDRQRLHLAELLTFPETYFLIHDADSVCMSPELPRYIYEEPHHVWSNVVGDPFHDNPPAYPPGWPHIAFQPPYFLARATIEKLLSVAGGIQANPTLPFIDHYMLQLTLAAGLSYRGFPTGASCPTGPDHPPGRERMSFLVREHGCVFLHAIKQRDFLDHLWRERQVYLRAHP